ncbi:MAG: phosphopentomutase [Proteobacteria bacterium]|nr:phosphopentomutase [Pseudomonadota bacterium]
MNSRRAILIVMDGVGIGEMPDSHLFNDSGVNSLLHVSETTDGLDLPNMSALGLGNSAAIPTQKEPVSPLIKGVPINKKPSGFYGKMAEISPGKDSIYGHWELMGCIAETPFTLFPNGFPESIMQSFAGIAGREAMGNVTASGTEIIDRLGKQHLETQRLIVYTSADSVFQIAAHEEVVPIEELYKICEETRKMLNPLNIGRVIARPFIGTPGNFNRTKRRRDFSLPPSRKTLLDILVDNGIEVFGFGKIDDLFASRGVSEIIKVESNGDAMKKLIDHTKQNSTGFFFANLNDTDTVYGHRRNPQGYAKALKEVDDGLFPLMKSMSSNDLLIISADHGCDPTLKRHTDHTREYVPLLVYTPHKKSGESLGLRSTFADVGKTIADYFKIETKLPGKSFFNYLENRS